MDNYKTALDSERKKVVRIFQHYTPEQRANIAASHRQHHRQKQRIGEFFYMHPDIPGSGFETRTRAAEAALRRQQ